MRLPARRSYRCLAVLFAAALGAAPLEAADGASQCGGYPRLVPNDYTANAKQFDAVCFPEAWQFMSQNRWQGRSVGVPAWPFLVVIDDGFFGTFDTSIDPRAYPGYPDGTGTLPLGTALGDTSPSPLYGFHGTAVLSLLASRANNGWIAGAVAPWSVVPGGSEWGAACFPVRSGRGFPTSSSTTLVAEIFQKVVLVHPEARTINVSQSLVDVTKADDLKDQINFADWQQDVVVTGAGNKLGTVAANAWIRQFENVIVVGGLNETGTKQWVESTTDGSATGPGVDLYAPAKGFTVFLHDNATAVASGTSFSSPLVAAAVAMIQNVDPTLDSWVVRDVLVKTADPNAGLPRLNVIKALVCTAALQQSASYPPPGSNTLPVHYWSCAMGTPFGSASGQRVGW